MMAVRMRPPLSPKAHAMALHFLVNADYAPRAFFIAASVAGSARRSFPVRATQHSGIGWTRVLIPPPAFNLRETAGYYHRLLAVA